MNSVYTINKGVGKPIVFKGIKAQYITYLAIGLVVLLLLFAALYVSGIHLAICLVLIATLGTGLFFGVIYASKHFGQHGLKKWMARNRLPETLRFRSRHLFTRLKYTDHYDLR